MYADKNYHFYSCMTQLPKEEFFFCLIVLKEHTNEINCLETWERKRRDNRFNLDNTKKASIKAIHQVGESVDFVSSKIIPKN